MPAKSSTASSAKPRKPRAPRAPRKSPAAAASAAALAAEKARTFAIEAARLMADLKCEDLVVLDVRGLSQITNFVILATGTSERQMRSVSDDVEELGSSLNYSAFRSRGERSPNWSIVDFTDVTVHIFEPNARAFYDLENLWPDAKRITWRRRASSSSSKSRADAAAATPAQ